jgi:hypothetical protein
VGIEGETSMQGTPKQIEYAQSIITKLISKMDSRVDSLKKYATTPRGHANAELAELLRAAVLNLINTHYTASFIIDNKNYMESPEYHIKKLWKTTLAKDIHIKLKQFLNDKIIEQSDVDVIVKKW